MRITRTLTALALVMGLGAAPAYADVFGIDEDEDLGITEEEWGLYGDETFGEVDVDESGFIDEEEYEGWYTEAGLDEDPLLGDERLYDRFGATEEGIGEEGWFGDEGFAGLDEDESGVLEEDEWGWF